MDKAKMDKKLCAFYTAHPGEREDLQRQIEGIANNDKVATPGKRIRYSDQFSPVTKEQLYIERERNRRARVVYKFKKEHGEMDAEIGKWRDAAVECGRELARGTGDTKSAAAELHGLFNLESIGVSQEECE